MNEIIEQKEKIKDKSFQSLYDKGDLKVDGELLTYRDNTTMPIKRNYSESRFLNKKNRRDRKKIGNQVLAKITINPNVKGEYIYDKVINYNSSQFLNTKQRYIPKRKGTLYSSEAIINRNNKVEVIPSKVIKITSTIVVFECITDVKNQCYETREFPIILFEKYSFLKVGLVCNLNIILSPNNFNLTITNLNDSKIENLFDTSNLFEGLEDLNVHYL